MTSPRNLSVVAFLHALLVAALASQASLKPAAPRQVVDLNGTWQVGEGSMDQQPQAFDRTVPVPGLLDMATPAFADVGTPSPRRDAFWYRRTFKLPGDASFTRPILKIHKSMYGTRVFLNGQIVGDHVPCFTPAYFDVAKHLRTDGRENELVVRVGANRASLPPGIPNGWDAEKYLYQPGIYDSVEMILTGDPYIANVQTVPDLPGKAVRIVAEIAAPAGADVAVTADVAEAKSGKAAGSARPAAVRAAADGTAVVDFTIPLSDVRLWSPEDPFLYSLTLRTPGDAATVRFGMRSFRFDPETRRAMLNGRPYFMRGTNVTLFRFFEDAARGDLPWRQDWVRRLHQSFKTMHWNAIRYCIGFPPEFWYDIADEEGFLIQDEFPVWLLGTVAKSDPPAVEHSVTQYTQWMRERWNHPCVVLWDAQNESPTTDQTGEAIKAVRHLDLSNRPWDNGWRQPQDPGDSTEAHPYLFRLAHATKGKQAFHLSDLANVAGTPDLRPAQERYGAAIIINEYGWLWLTRDGQPTRLTRAVYDHLTGPNATPEQRRLTRARHLAALTEFWRARRACAGVLHFCALGYSRPADQPDARHGGATSDEFLDVERLVYEPNFTRYVRDAFNPVGIMLDFWAERAAPAESRELSVVVTNDLLQEWTGKVRLEVIKGDTVVDQQSQPCNVPAFGSHTLRLTQKLPSTPGDYTLAAVLVDADGKAVRSLRDVKVGPPAPNTTAPAK